MSSLVAGFKGFLIVGVGSITDVINAQLQLNIIEQKIIANL